MRLLLDTNVLIDLQPESVGDAQTRTRAAISLARLANTGGHELVMHPAVFLDIDRDKNRERQALSRMLVGRYTPLSDPPPATPALIPLLGDPVAGTNDWVDDQQLAALADDRVDFLVTEDQGIHRKARRIGLAERVLTVADAVATLWSLFDAAPDPPPHVRRIGCHALNREDPIFDSFREDYEGFDQWLRKARRQERDAWVIEKPEGPYAGIVIVQPKANGKLGLPGKVLKICSFKVEQDASGHRFGELLLKTVFEYCRANGYAGAYLTAFPKHERLVALVEDFGFEAESSTTSGGEVLLRKSFSPPDATLGIGRLDHHVRFGPHAFHPEAEAFVVPIKPRYQRLLFPDAERQQSLLAEPTPFGCAIRKAYLCNAQIKSLPPGSLALFYQSKDERAGRSKGAASSSIVEQAIHCVGVVERVVRSNDPATIAREVGKRTVYSYEEIKGLAAREVLVILFRHAWTLSMPITLREMRDSHALNGPPQSVTKVRPEGVSWLKNRVVV